MIAARRLLVLLSFAAIVAVDVPTAHCATLEEVRLLQSDETGLEAETEVPPAEVLPAPGRGGYHVVKVGNIPSAGEPGEPSLPSFSFWIAVPPGTEPQVDGTPIGEILYDGVRPIPIPRPEWIEGREGGEPVYQETIVENAAAYGGGNPPSPSAIVGRGSTLRHLRVVPIIVRPARWDAATGLLRVAQKVRIKVSFVPRSERAVGRPVGRDGSSWERTYDAVVLNHQEARGWRRAPVGPARPKARVAAENLVKLEVKSSGMKIVSFADLAAGGWSGEGTPLADLYLFERFHDPNDAENPVDQEVAVPILLLDGDGDGNWSDGDSFCFYGQHLFDRLPEAPAYIKRYGRRHVYWLGLRTGEANPRMQPASSWLGLENLPPVPSYRWRAHFEEEGGPVWGGIYAKMGAGAPGRQIDQETNLDRGVASVRTKHAYWLGFDPGFYGFNFDLPGYLGPIEVAARLQGILHPPESTRHKAFLYLTRSAAVDDTVRFPRTPLSFEYQDSLLYVAGQADLAGMPLRERGNRFALLIPPDAAVAYAALHWVEVSYLRAPRFVDGRVEVSTADLSGPTEYDLASAPDPAELLAFEITDPRAPKVLSIDPSSQYGQGRLRLQWNLTGSDRRFLFERLDAVRSIDLALGEQITVDSPSDLAAPGDQDYVIVIPREWIETIQPLIALRESQGHSVLVAPIEDLYDEFSGGRRWPHAIRSFLRALFASRDPAPSFLLLVGDATDGFDNGFETSDPNWVPTQTVFSNSYLTSQGPELVASDQWFVDNLTGTGETLDYMPDMHVGRFSAGDPAQLQLIVTKILAYENFQPDQGWRNRVLFVSDDAWSSAITFSETYAYKPGSEGIFAESARRSRDVIRRDGRLADLEADSFFVAQYMDSIPSLGRCVINPETGRCQRDQAGRLVMNTSAEWGPSRDYGTATVSPLLLSKMSQGYLFVSYNGHANARLMTHEYVFRHNSDVRVDIERLGNVDRPFVFMGYGCHLAEFSAVDEKLYARGDGICENLLNLYSDRAGVAGIASVGYEWLDTTDRYNLAVVRAFFTNPPQHEGHTRWVLGEIVSQSKANLLAQGPGNSTYESMSQTYTLIGDPGLVLDAAPPRLSILINGEPVESGRPLTLPPDSSSILVVTHIRDEVWARSLAIDDAYGPVPSDRINVVYDADGDRGFTASYRTTVLPRDYDLLLRAEDGNGRVTTAAFPVRVGVEFQTMRPLRDWAAISSGARVLREDSLRAVVSLPRPVGGDSLQFLVDGLPARFHTTRTPGAEEARGWTLTVREDVSSSESRTIAVRIEQPDGGARDFPQPPMTIQTEPLYAIEALYNVPNPFGKETWIFYSLGAPAEEVSIKIYTSSGRLIRTLLDLPSPQTLADQPILWNGLDEDGDRVANGLYFYKMSVAGSQGRLERIEKMARVR